MAPLSETSDVDLPLPVARERPGGRLGALAEMLLCSGFLSQLALSIVVQGLGIGHADESGRLSLPFVAAVSLSDTVLVVGLMVWFTRRRGERPSTLWLGSRPVRHEARIGLLSAPLLLLAVGTILGILQRVAPYLHNVPDNPLEAIARGSIADAIGLGVVAVVAGAVREELQRAFLQDRFERHFGPPAAGVFVLSTLFGLGHVLQGWDAVVATAVLGAVWASIYVSRRSIVCRSSATPASIRSRSSGCWRQCKVAGVRGPLPSLGFRAWQHDVGASLEVGDPLRHRVAAPGCGRPFTRLGEHRLKGRQHTVASELAGVRAVVVAGLLVGHRHVRTEALVQIRVDPQRLAGQRLDLTIGQAVIAAQHRRIGHTRAHPGDFGFDGCGRRFLRWESGNLADEDLAPDHLANLVGLGARIDDAEGRRRAYVRQQDERPVHARGDAIDDLRRPGALGT